MSTKYPSRLDLEAEDLFASWHQKQIVDAHGDTIDCQQTPT
ncbi:uncharacterized protein CLUP02_08198 [Colletotrichum lupini]|uniref:Uncharacterized protein n=1 Tax=Colletotrichum lupini TaxID=145971 RepID=A0A9Q8SSM7_9PEZI|nr:uncharacterized protein CLUP02_08198 [Colletotrichum lupini]UQC82708.1 hypothetical protein CLUP02_08198 [Colletotrichum lupini]